MPAKASKLGIYYINLARSADRRKLMESQFRKLKAKAVRVPAVDSKTAKTLVGETSWKCWGTRDVEYACTLSHVKAILQAYLDGCELAVIFEDDMQILRLPTLKLIKSAPRDWEILQLSTIGPWADKLIQNPPAYFVPWRITHFNTGAYLINKTGMSKILNSVMQQTKSIALDQIKYSFSKARFVSSLIPQIPGIQKPCNADVFVYNQCKTYTCCDISCHENRTLLSTINPGHKSVHDTTAELIQNLLIHRGFLMKW